ncbi:MAG: GNAT family N-acetyltransferase [Firmicutes bacterium HGW-Firmicutes-16]|nr:MAG: GNAT family N-acetyltransferase [Firmicutes bacterium HGW-Firmicutes-16]
MNINIRLENEKDFEKVENLTREAFWDIYQPGCDEHLLAHKLRKVPAFIPELDFIVELDGQIVGNILYSKAIIVDESDKEHEVVTFGPLSVLPSQQKTGIGSKLINHTIELVKKMGYKAIVIFGNPAYYHRFGFVNAEEFHINTADGGNFDAFMVLELYEGALQGISGKFREDAVFHIEKAELEEFERKFPYKEKHITDTQFR